MTNLSTAPAPNRLSKLRRQFASRSFPELFEWGLRWLYWNARVYRVIPSYAVEQAYYRLKRFKHNKKYGVQDPIIVFQMGKVGSTSVYRGLKALELDVPVHQLHFLNYLDGIEKHASQNRGASSRLHEVFASGRRVRHEIDANPQQKWNLISLVRAPIPRTVSVFFYGLEYNYPQFAARVAKHELSAQDIAAYFVEHYKNDTTAHWFEQQIQDLFGIDVYASEFPKARGFQIFTRDNIRLLVIRLEDLNRCGAQAIQEFLGIPNFEILSERVGDLAENAELYREFRAALRLPPAYVEHFNNSKYATHFYTEQELADSVKRWT